MIQPVEWLIKYPWFDATQGMVYGKLSGSNSDGFNQFNDLLHIHDSTQLKVMYMANSLAVTQTCFNRWYNLDMFQPVEWRITYSWYGATKGVVHGKRLSQ